MKVNSASAKTALMSLAMAAVAACDTSPGYEAGGTQKADPVVVDHPVAFVERPLPIDDDGAFAAFDILNPAAFHPGAQLVLKDRASASAAEVVVTAGVFTSPDGQQPLYDVKDLSVSPDGRRLLFAMRAPEIPGANESDQPTWNIWELDLTDRELRPLMQSEALAERGDDVAPQYLADGRIVFSSNRQQRSRAILLDEGKPQYAALDDERQHAAFNLHVMNDYPVLDDLGENIEQITFNPSHDLAPTVEEDGTITYLRWDAFDRHSRLSLYRVNPDGTQPELYYGFHSQETGTQGAEAAFSNPFPLADGRTLVTLQPRVSTRLGGDLVAIDGENFTDLNQTVFTSAGQEGPAQESLAGAVDSSGLLPSRGGHFSSAFPLGDDSGRFLVSWSQCRLIDPETDRPVPCREPLLSAEDVQQAAPLYGLWVYDPHTQSQLPVKLPTEGLMYTDAVLMAPRPAPVRPELEPKDEDLVAEGVGVLHIRNVYDLDGINTSAVGLASTLDPTQTPPNSRRLRFLRLVKHVPAPPTDVLEFDADLIGPAGFMREIVGYAPIEPDGSVKVKVPADVAFSFDLLDARGQRVEPRHDVWLNLRPGEVRNCSGCHSAGSELPHGREAAETPSSNQGSPGGMHFPNNLLLDDSGTPQPLPEAGETMAEYYARLNGPRTPSMDIVWQDEWTDPASGAQAGDDIGYRYQTVATLLNRNPADSNCEPLDPAPTPWMLPTDCTTNWDAHCRSTINYLEHIQPLWQADRRSCDAAGNVLEDATCVSCHSRGQGLDVQLPAGQLELTGDASADDSTYVTSYAELLFEDNEQEISGGTLVDVTAEVHTGEYQRDAEGELVLDENGEPIPVNQSSASVVPPLLSTSGARNSQAFFAAFTAGGAHAGWLSDDELKLIAEWLDVGAQYYNNPFAIPAEQ